MTTLTLCRRCRWLSWHHVSVVNYYADRRFSRICLRKWKVLQNRFFLIIWGPSGFFFFKCWKSRDTVPLNTLISVRSTQDPGIFIRILHTCSMFYSSSWVIHSPPISSHHPPATQKGSVHCIHTEVISHQNPSYTSRYVVIHSRLFSNKNKGAQCWLSWYERSSVTRFVLTIFFVKLAPEPLIDEYGFDCAGHHVKLYDLTPWCHKTHKHFTFKNRQAIDLRVSSNRDRFFWKSEDGDFFSEFSNQQRRHLETFLIYVN